MNGSTSSTTTDLTALQEELHGYIVDELGSGPIAADDDLIKLGIIDSLGVQQLVELCEARYGIRVVEADLVPENFQTLRELADYVERKRGTQPSASGRRGLWLRKR
jgi:acyl carrier protein